MNLSINKSERGFAMALQLKKLDITMKSALDAFIADWKREEIIPSTVNKYDGDMQRFVDYLDHFHKRIGTETIVLVYLDYFVDDIPNL